MGGRRCLGVPGLRNRRSRSAGAIVRRRRDAEHLAEEGRAEQPASAPIGMGGPSPQPADLAPLAPRTSSPQVDRVPPPAPWPMDSGRSRPLRAQPLERDEPHARGGASGAALVPGPRHPHRPDRAATHQGLKASARPLPELEFVHLKEIQGTPAPFGSSPLWSGVCTFSEYGAPRARVRHPKPYVHRAQCLGYGTNHLWHQSSVHGVVPGVG